MIRKPKHAGPASPEASGQIIRLTSSANDGTPQRASRAIRSVGVSERPPRVSGLLPNDLKHDAGREVELIEEEAVRIDRCDTERLEYVFRVVPQVGGHDRVCPAPDCGGNDVAIVGVGKCERRLDVLPALDEGVLERAVHGIDPSLDVVRSEVRMDLEDCVGRLVEDALRPERPV